MHHPYSPSQRLVRPRTDQYEEPPSDVDAVEYSRRHYVPAGYARNVARSLQPVHHYSGHTPRSYGAYDRPFDADTYQMMENERGLVPDERDIALDERYDRASIGNEEDMMEHQMYSGTPLYMRNMSNPTSITQNDTYGARPTSYMGSSTDHSSYDSSRQARSIPAPAVYKSDYDRHQLLRERLERKIGRRIEERASAPMDTASRQSAWMNEHEYEDRRAVPPVYVPRSEPAGLQRSYGLYREGADHFSNVSRCSTPRSQYDDPYASIVHEQRAGDSRWRTNREALIGNSLSSYSGNTYRPVSKEDAIASHDIEGRKEEVAEEKAPAPRSSVEPSSTDRSSSLQEVSGSDSLRNDSGWNITNADDGVDTNGRKCGRKSMNYSSAEKRERNRAAVKKCRARQALKYNYLQQKAEALEAENKNLTALMESNETLSSEKQLGLRRGIQMDILLKIKEIFTQSLPKDFALDADAIWDLNSVLAVSMPSRCYYGIESIKEFWRTSLRMRNKGKIRSFWAWLFRLPPGDRFHEFEIEPFSPTSNLYFMSWTTKSNPPLKGSIVILFGQSHRVTLHVECFGWLIWRYLLTNTPFPEQSNQPPPAGQRA